MKPPKKPRVAFTCTVEDGCIDCDYTVTDGLGLMQWDGWSWDDELKQHIPHLTPMYSDLTFLSDPDLSDDQAEGLLKDFFDYILQNRKQAMALLHNRMNVPV